MGKYRHTTLLIPPEDRARLEQIARKLGCVQTRGVGAGEVGSISALMCAIARGEYTVTQKESRNANSHSPLAPLDDANRGNAEN